MFRHAYTLAWNRKEYVVYLKTLEEIDSISDDLDVMFRLASTVDIPWMSDNSTHMGDAAEQLLRQQFLHTRDLTVIGVSKDQSHTLVFSAWLSFEDFGLTLLGDHARSGDVSIRRIWVPPTHRRKGLASRGCIVTGQAAQATFVTDGSKRPDCLHAERTYCKCKTGPRKSSLK